MHANISDEASELFWLTADSVMPPKDGQKNEQVNSQVNVIIC